MFTARMSCTRLRYEDKSIQFAMKKIIKKKITHQIPIVSKSSCKSVYSDYFISDNMFCAGHKEGRIDSCAGDSGTSSGDETK
jgi:hypothetical protein